MDSGVDSTMDKTENVDFSLVLQAFPRLLGGPRWIREWALVDPTTENVNFPLVLQHFQPRENGGTTEEQRRNNGGTTEEQRRYAPRRGPL